jgi:hypothetical protein
MKELEVAPSYGNAAEKMTLYPNGPGAHQSEGMMLLKWIDKLRKTQVYLRENVSSISP